MLCLNFDFCDILNFYCSLIYAPYDFNGRLYSNKNFFKLIFLDFSLPN